MAYTRRRIDTNEACTGRYGNNWGVAFFTDPLVQPVEFDFGEKLEFNPLVEAQVIATNIDRGEVALISLQRECRKRRHSVYPGINPRQDNHRWELMANIAFIDRGAVRIPLSTQSLYREVDENGYGTATRLNGGKIGDLNPVLHPPCSEVLAISEGYRLGHAIRSQHSRGEPYTYIGLWGLGAEILSSADLQRS